jgi:hypothetical protein
MVEFEIHVPEKFPVNLDFIEKLNYDVILDSTIL